jgi:hypothetical protein
MRTALVLGLAVGLMGRGGEAARGDDRPAALAVVEKAIKAQGGAEGLARAAVAQRQGKGTLALSGVDYPFTTEETLNLPGQFRYRNEAGKKQLVRVINGDKGWVQAAGGMTVEMNRDRLAEQMEEAYVLWLVTLAPLVKDSFNLDVLPEVKVAGRPAAGVKVTARGRPEVAMYFDKESGVLVKITRRAREAGLEVEKEYLYSDYKDIDGVKLPTREVTTVNNRKFSEVQYTEYKLLRRSDESAFDRP